MPPRYAYWTILIDSKPTAFRAREKEELLPTLHQLRRTSKDVVMKWFARGRLWETPEEASAAQRKKVAPERRGPQWRPGGAHKDPRERFKKGAKPGAPDAAQVFRPAHKRAAHKPSGVAQVFRPAHKRPGQKPSGVAQVFRPAHKPTGVAQVFRPAHKPSGVAQVFRPAHKSRERRPWTNKPSSGAGASQPRREAHRQPAFTPERRESEAPPRPVDDSRPEPAPRPEGPDRKHEPPERG